MRRLGVVILTLLLVMALAVPGVVAAPRKERATTPDWKYTFSVVFTANNVPLEFSSQVEAMGGMVSETIPEIGFAQVRATKGELVRQLQQLPGVQSVGPAIRWRLPEEQRVAYVEEVVKTKGKAAKDAVTVASADLYDLYQWDIKQVTSDGRSFELSTGSHDTVVAVVDTGIDSNHPDIVGNLASGSQNFVPEGGIYNPYGTPNPNAFDDLNGHGTHVAGSIAGNGRILGVAPDVAVRAYRVLDERGSGYTHWIVNGIIAAANDGCDVISMSLGGIDIVGQYFWTDPETGIEYKLGNDVADLLLYKRAIQYAAAQGCIVVASAGNDALNCTVKADVTDFFNAEYGEYGYRAVGAGFKVPAVIPGVITVSATGPDGDLASYSNYGPGYIDVAAPGGDFQRYPNGDWYTDMCLSSYKNGGYVWMAGTSMAAPKVSAVAALLVDEYGDQLTSSQITQLLYQQGVEHVYGTDRALFGYGHVNAYLALGGGQP